MSAEVEAQADSREWARVAIAQRAHSNWLKLTPTEKRLTGLDDRNISLSDLRGHLQQEHTQA